MVERLARGTGVPVLAWEAGTLAPGHRRLVSARRRKWRQNDK